jgi:hypothetical protein
MTVVTSGAAPWPCPGLTRMAPAATGGCPSSYTGIDYPQGRATRSATDLAFANTGAGRVVAVEVADVGNRTGGVLVAESGLSPVS